MCDGSKLRPKFSSGMSLNMRRQITGLVARFLPPGHSSLLNDIGQLSIPMRIPWPAAKAISGFQIFKKRGQLSSTDLVQSRPTNVFTQLTPSFSAATITFLMWSTYILDSAASGANGLG